MRDEATIGEPAETHERVRHAQPLVAPAMRELQRLRDELDLANAATTEFHVEAALLLDLPIDLLFGEPHTRERTAHAYVRTEYCRRHRFLEAREQFDGTSGGARANQRLAFPVLCGLQVVTLGFLQRTRERAVAPVRAQTQVNAIRCTFTARLAHDARDRFGEFDEVLAITDFAALACSRGCALV